MPVQNKLQTIGFRASNAERDLFDKWAEKLGLRLSAYIRLCVLNDIASRKEPKPPAEVMTTLETLNRVVGGRPRKQEA